MKSTKDKSLVAYGRAKRLPDSFPGSLISCVPRLRIRRMSNWIEEQKSRSGEIIPASKMAWRLMNRERLKSAFPKAERKFCRVVDTLRFHLKGQSLSLLRYQRQKLFSINSEICFYVDFYFKPWKLAVEIDGDSHSGKEAIQMDTWRELMLSTNGMRFLRLHNNFVETADWWEIEDKLMDSIMNVQGHALMKATLIKGLQHLPDRQRPTLSPLQHPKRIV